MITNSRYQPISEINVTSLVDVTMVLLIIFMITAPLMRSSIDLKLPTYKSDDLNPQQGIVVTLTRSGTIKLGDETTGWDNFESKLLHLYASSSRKIVLLQADQEVAYGKVIQLMDRIKRAGIDRVGLIVKPEPER